MLQSHSTHRVAMITFSREFHHGKISPAWWGGGGHPNPFTVSTITSKVVVHTPLFLLYPYMYSVVTIYCICKYKSNVKFTGF
jgi:hypothetical protein